MKQKLAAGVAVVALAAGATAAYAYFTASNGSDTGTVTVGDASAWTVANDGTVGGPLLPDSGTETVSYTVTNPSDGHQYLKSVKVTIPSSDGDVLDSTSHLAITGCKASWFQVTDDNTGLPADIAGHDTYSGSSDIVLNNSTTDNQDACKNASFDVTITASSVD